MARALVVALALAGWLAFGAASAAAALICVNASPCVGGTAMPTIQAALDHAAFSSAGQDTVRIGPGTYTESPSYTTAEPVHVVGAGRGETVINSDGNPTTFVLRLTPSSTIKGMTLEVPDVPSGIALRWDGTATEIEAIHNGPAATAINGMRAEGNAVLESSRVRVDGLRAMLLHDATGVVVRDSEIRGGPSAISDGSGGGKLTVSRSTISARGTGIFVAGAGSTLNIDNTVLRDRDAAFSGGAMLSVASGGNVVARHLTIVGPGGAGTDSRGVTIGADASNSSLTMFDSIIDGFDTSFLCLGVPPNVATLGVSYTNFSEPASVGNPQCNTTFGAGNDTTTEPVFLGGILSDYRLRAPSPLIDAASPADPLTVDRLGEPRPVDGDGSGGARADMGAFEYQRRPPHAAIKAPATVAVGQPAAFTAAGSGDPDAGDVLSYAWDFGDGGTATGFSASHTFSSRGPRTVKLTATDPTGLRATATVDVKVRLPVIPGAKPDTTITAGPTRKQLRSGRARFAFGASEAGARFQCKLDAARFGSCSSPKRYKRLAPGRHSFAVRAVDADGADPTPAKRRFRVGRR